MTFIDLITRLCYAVLHIVGPADSAQIKGLRTMLTTEKCVAHFSANGLLSGPPQWSVDQPLVTLAPAADGLTCWVNGVGNGVGTVNITATEPPRADGTASVSDTKPLTITLPPATSAAITFDAPIPQ